MTPPQTKAIYALLNKLNLQAHKADIIAGISNGRTSSLKELSKQEGIDLIKWLKSQDPQEQQADKMRRKIIAIARDLGWVKSYIDKSGNMIQKADMQAIDNWCQQFGYLHKKLNQYQYSELPKLVSQFQNVQSHKLKSL